MHFLYNSLQPKNTDFRAEILATYIRSLQFIYWEA